ncbi:MAG: CpsB/CapC family capsule biosynthesis tyrosine phosphatase [Gemmataceae bacterium]
MPLADTHVHLLAGLDDGPATLSEAVAMSRFLIAEGAGLATALAHQNPDYPENTPERLRAAAAALAAELQRKKVKLAVHPTGEVMLGPDTLADWHAGRLLTIGDTGAYLLVEMPHRDFRDVLPLAAAVAPTRLVIAHAERYPQLLFDPPRAAAWVASGCLLQVTASALAEPWDDDMARGLRAWADAGMIHVIGSDGHGIDRRRPLLADGYRALRALAGRAAARRAGEEWGAAVLRGEPLPVPMPAPRRSWFARVLGA